MRRFNKKKKPKYHTKYRYYEGLMCYAKSSKSSSHHIYWKKDKYEYCFKLIHINYKEKLHNVS
jgi:hypothetical protein